MKVDPAWPRRKLPSLALAWCEHWAEQPGCPGLLISVRGVTRNLPSEYPQMPIAEYSRLFLPAAVRALQAQNGPFCSAGSPQRVLGR